jgi:pilus assembly protein Flp/PilA
MKVLRTLWMDDAGQDVVEYALIAGLVSIVAYLAITGTGSTVNNIWSAVNSDLGTAQPAG